MKKIILCLLFLFSACAGDTKKDSRLEGAIPPENNAKNSVSIEAKLAAAQDDTQDLTEITFDKTSSALTSTGAERVNTALATAQKKAKIKHVLLVVWSDAEMPKGAESLPEDEVKLAEARAKTLRDYIKQQHQDLKVKTVNMAKKSNRLDHFLKTKDARIQDALSSSGTGSPKASHAVVIIQTERQKKID
jgi:hypothetical protein